MANQHRNTVQILHGIRRIVSDSVPNSVPVVFESASIADGPAPFQNRHNQQGNKRPRRCGGQPFSDFPFARWQRPYAEYFAVGVRQCYSVERRAGLAIHDCKAAKIQVWMRSYARLT
jgi:hypothetical protein